MGVPTPYMSTRLFHNKFTVSHLKKSHFDKVNESRGSAGLFLLRYENGIISKKFI